MQHYSDNVQDLQGNARPGVPVSVYSGAVLATIYSDNGTTVKANPMTSGAGGAFDFYAANGDYTISVGGSSKSVTLFDVAAAPTATPTSSSTVLGETAGVVRRFVLSDLPYDEGLIQDVLDDAKPMQSYTALRAYTGRATGVRITSAGVAGFFARSTTDTTSADNGGTIIVDGAGRRWLRLYSGAINVKWFGAVGNGVTDDTAAIQAAINSVSSGGIVFMPPGSYTFTTLAIAGSFTHLIGAGRGRTNLLATSTSSGITGAAKNNLYFADFTITKHGTNAGTIANMIDLTSPHESVLERLNIGGGTTTAVAVDAVYNFEMSRCVLQGVAGYTGNGLRVTSGGGASTTCRAIANEFTDFNCAIDWDATYGTNTHENIFVGNSICVNLSGGNTHALSGNWYETADAGKYFLTVNGSGTVNVYSASNRKSGANPPSYVNLTGGATRAQLQIFEGQSSGEINYSHNVARCQVKNSAAQAVAHNTNTVLSWDTENFDTDAMHAGGTPARITIATSGTYRFSVNLAFGGNVNGYRLAYLRKNGATDVRAATNPTTGNTDPVYLSLTTLVACAAGDYFDVVAYQNSGGSLDVLSGETSVFECEWVGT